MRVRVLGSAAGGGFPQWNCSCPNCFSLRQNKPGYRPLSQSQLALSTTPGQWHLLNGSPDLRFQLLKYPDMLPAPESPRISPIQSMTITNADVDHTLGLILLRETARINVRSSAFVKQALLDGNAYFGMLKQSDDQLNWKTVEGGETFNFENLDGRPSGLSARVVALEGSAPYWAKARFPAPSEPVQGLIISHNGARLGYFPCVARLDAGLIDLLSSCDVLFFDGTFWTDDEIQKIKGGTRSGKDMGHVAMSDSIPLLKAIRAKKYFIHINNTNPALNEQGPEYAELREAGFELARDGQEFEL